MLFAGRQSLRVLDEFRSKLDSQRSEIRSLKQQLERSREELAAKDAAVAQGRLSLLDHQEQWGRPAKGHLRAWRRLAKSHGGPLLGWLLRASPLFHA